MRIQLAIIGTLNETPLHAALKEHYLRPGDALEVKIHGYVVDVVRDDFWIEIQTSNVGTIKRKLGVLIEQHPVRLVLPVALERWIVKEGPAGEHLGRRKSPKRGAVEMIFSELVGIPHLLAHPNFSVAALLIQEEEVRRHDPSHNWRRKGWGTTDRRLIAVVEERVFCTPNELAALLPPDVTEPFTARQLATALDQPGWLAHKMIYCLRETGILTAVGKVGRALAYSRRGSQ